MSNVKLGQLIEGEVARDAVHVAVAPVTAAYFLRRGEEIGFVEKGNDSLVGLVESDPIGVVDPFLKAPGVQQGERFYMILYPNSITGLRHDWTHPAFSAERPSSPLLDESMAWVSDFAKKIGMTYADLIQAADDYIQDGTYIHRGDDQSYEDYYSEMPQFWVHYERITGRQVADRDAAPFTCSC